MSVAGLMQRIARPQAFVLALALASAAIAPVAWAQQVPDAPPDGLTEEIKAYCANIADAARDQRYLRQTKELQDLQSQVDERIRVLEQRRDEYREWMTKREEFLKVAETTLLDIYKKMRPDAAARQLELVNPEVAAAIVMKLNSRLASQILNEMAADKAAGLASIIADAASKDLPREPS